jgi:curved DNA-binding protein CbpA
MHEMPDKSYYRLLQVDPSADPDVIAAAHRILAARLHPETDFTGIQEYRLKELDRALAVLSDPEKRRAYDEKLAAEEASGAEVAVSRLSERVPMGPGAGNASRQGYTLAERLQANDMGQLGQMRLDFGRYNGVTLGELVRSDPDYLRWLARHSSGVRYRRAILRLLADHEEQRQPLRVGS